MEPAMKRAFRSFPRNGVYYSEDTETGKQKSLKTRDPEEADRLLNAMNEARKNSASINLQIGRIYIAAADPKAATRTWKDVFDAVLPTVKGPTLERWETAEKDEALDSLWKIRVLETQPMDFLGALNTGTVSTNVFLRRLNNFAFGMGWMPTQVLPKKLWPKVQYKEKRAIVLQEHLSILLNEKNVEKNKYWGLSWYLGASQTDMAWLHGEDINRQERTIFYRRRKNKGAALQRYGKKVEALLNILPTSGPLFPRMKEMTSSERATEFKRACKRADVSGVTHHCYRYAWAERALLAGFEERYAQAALGHGSKAVARAYAKKAPLILPSLEEYEERNAAKNVVPMPAQNNPEVAGPSAAAV